MIQENSLPLQNYLTTIYNQPKELTLGTVGPDGTSSENVAKKFIENVSYYDNIDINVRLYDDYQHCLKHLIDHRIDLTMVPHSYRHIKQFYTNPQIRLIYQFTQYTSMFGLAARKDAVIDFESLQNEIVHCDPALAVLMYNFIQEKNLEIDYAGSTSEAAKSVVEGKYTLAITDEKCVETHGLKFIQSFRPVSMIWSLFSLNMS